MNTSYTISLIPAENIYSILPLVSGLNPSLTEEELIVRLNEMLEQGYECVGVYEGNKLIAISGLWTITKLYVGKHMEPDNVVVDQEYRNKGIGNLLMNWIYDYARSKGCVASELNCYVSNSKGQKFWEREGFTLLGHHYQKKL